MFGLRVTTKDKFLSLIQHALFLFTFLYNKICKLPSDFEKKPTNLISNRSDLGNQLISGVFNKYIVKVESSVDTRKLFEDKNRSVKVLNPNSFSWLYLLTGINNQKSRDLAKYFANELGFFRKKYSRKMWDPETTGLRLCAICLNLRFFELSKIFTDKYVIMSFIHFHVVYLSLCKIFVPKGLASLRVNSGIFFASLVLGETIIKRPRVLKKFVKDINFLLQKNGEIKSRNPHELLEVLFLVNRFIKFSSTSELSSGEIEKKLKRFQNQIAPILRGLRLGNGNLVRANGCGGEVVPWNLDKELSDAKLSNFSVKKNSMGFHRVTAGRLKVIFDGKTNNIEKRSKNYCCPAFSFELTSGQRTIFQNNAAFNCFLGHSSSILAVKEEYNSVRFSTKIGSKQLSLWSSTIKEVKNYRDHENNYLEGTKVIHVDQMDIIHSRKLTIPLSGNEIRGSDSIYLEDTDFEEFNIQFFLHPDVDVWKSEGSNYFLLQLKNKEIWNFETDIGNGSLHSYKYLDPKDLRSKKAFVIVLKRGLKNKKLLVTWRFFLQNYSRKITREKIS